MAMVIITSTVITTTIVAGSSPRRLDGRIGSRVTNSHPHTRVHSMTSFQHDTYFRKELAHVNLHN